MVKWNSNEGVHLLQHRGISTWNVVEVVSPIWVCCSFALSTTPLIMNYAAFYSVPPTQGGHSYDPQLIPDTAAMRYTPLALITLRYYVKRKHLCS